MRLTFFNAIHKFPPCPLTSNLLLYCSQFAAHAKKLLETDGAQPFPYLQRSPRA